MRVDSVLRILKSFWKALVAFFLIVGGLASLHALGLLVPLVSALFSVCMIPIPLWWVGALMIVLVVFQDLLHKSTLWPKGEEVLESDYARRIVKLCQEPQSAQYLRNQYDAWIRESPVVVIGGLTFNDYLERLEGAGLIGFSQAKWQSTKRAIDLIDKYHGK
jgi:hypothetical protein